MSRMQTTEEEVWLHSFLTSATDQGKVAVLSPREISGTQSRGGWAGIGEYKNLFLGRNRTPYRIHALHRLTQFLKRKKNQILTFPNACRVFPCGNESAGRILLCDNTGCWAGYAVTDHVPACWSSNFNWTPLHIHIHTAYLLKSELRTVQLTQRNH